MMEFVSLASQPMVDISKLAGIFHKYAKKAKSIDEIIKEEEDAVGDAIVEKYKGRMGSQN